MLNVILNNSASSATADSGAPTEQKHFDRLDAARLPARPHRDVPRLRRRLPADHRQVHGQDESSRGRS